MWQRWNQTTHIFEKSTDNGAIWTPLGLSAAIITEGVMDIARLPPYPSAGLTPEYGTWTPTLLLGSGSTGMTYGVRTGTWMKLDKQVTAECVINLTAKGTSTGIVTITGMPYSSNNRACAALNYGAWAGLTGPVVAISIGNIIYLNQSGAAGQTNTTEANLTNTSTIFFTLVMRTP